jgi:hypothetical protein
MLFSADHLHAIRTHRHKVRLAGCWGGCYEVACFIEYQFGWRRVDGVYALPDGRPIFLHSWNITPDGSLCDGTADQFGEGDDVVCLDADCGQAKRYREKYTTAYNPSVTPWLKDAPYIGLPDRQFWDGREETRTLEPGWWLVDREQYLSWFANGVRHYPMFASMCARYRERGYDVSALD